MSLFIHISIHVFLGLLAGLIVYRVWKRPVASFLSALAGGVAVDIDHFFDYFVAFGLTFRLDYFLSGFQFLKNNKIFILWHGWEYVIILILLAAYLEKKVVRSVCLGVALGMFFHLGADTLINGLPVRSYSVIYRAANSFETEKLVRREHYLRHIEERKAMGFE